VTRPASSPLASTRRVSKTFTHSAVPDDLTDRAQGGASFLRVLLKRFPYHTESEWRARILDGRVTLQGIQATPDTLVSRGDLITYQVDDYEEPAVPIDFRELVVAGDLALVHKPAGLPVHKTGKVFVNVLANLYRAFKHDDAWTPLNRLDVETSGIVAFGRGRDALRTFSPGNEASVWTKTYLAVVDGVIEHPVTHDGPLAEWPEHPIRSRMRVHASGKAALTHFHPLAVREGKTLVLARPVTGRKHQIRAHMADLGFPIVGDKVYNHDGYYYLKRLEGELSAEDVAVLQSPHQMLHAVSLKISVSEPGDSKAVLAQLAGNDLGGMTERGPNSGGGSGASGIVGWDLNLPDSFRQLFPMVTDEWLQDRLNQIDVV
jgi:23S rRNA pseudouridine1911/1915/1917 synthase